MTALERQTRSRAWKKEKQEDAERRKLVAEILKITKREVSRPGGEIPATSATAINAKIRKYLRSFSDELLQESIEQLRTVLETKKNSPDSKGRLRNERSGEGDRVMGQSEVERLIAAQQHDTSLFEFEFDEDATEDAKQLAAGFKVRPQGAGPARDSVDSTDTDEDTPKSSTQPWKLTTDEKWLKIAMINIVTKLNLSFFSDGVQCPFCSEVLSYTAASNHLEEQYGKDMRDYTKWWDTSWSLQQIHLNGGPSIDPGQPNIPHLLGVKKEIEQLKKDTRKKPKKPAKT